MDAAPVGPVVSTAFFPDETEPAVVAPACLLAETLVDNLGFHVDEYCFSVTGVLEEGVRESLVGGSGLLSLCEHGVVEGLPYLVAALSYLNQRNRHYNTIKLCKYYLSSIEEF